MGMFSDPIGFLGKGNASGVAHKGMRESYFNPYNLSGSFGNISNTGGYVPTKKEWGKGMRPTPGTFSATLSPEMEALRTLFMNASAGALGQTGQSAGGFLGITPEMFAEFERSNNTLGQEFMDAGRGYLAEEQAMGPYDFEGTYQDQLRMMRDLDLNGEQREASSALDTLFGKGILASTPGGYQTEAFGNVLANRDTQRQLGASQVALSRGDQYNQIRQMLQSAGGTFGQLGQGMTADRFKRAMDMFGAGQEAETLGATRASGLLSGVGSMDQFLANLMQLSSNMGSQRSAANSNAFNPMIQEIMNRESENRSNLHDIGMQFMNFIPGAGAGG